MAIKDIFRNRIRFRSGAGSEVFEFTHGTGITFPKYDSALTPAAKYRGMPNYVEAGAGSNDLYGVVVKNTADAYVNRYPILGSVDNYTLAGNKRQVLASSGNTTMTAAMSGSLMLVDGATTAYTLPAIGAGDVGMWFDFLVTVASTGATITAGAADILTGGIVIMSTNAGLECDAFSADGVDDLVFTMNGTTKGGVVGSEVRYIAISATNWFVSGALIGSGTIVTPFS